MHSHHTVARQYGVAIRAMLILIGVLGIAYPLIVSGVGQGVLNAQANGSVVDLNGRTAGSALIGQSFTDDSGKALPEWFQSRPSAAGDGYDSGASMGSNLGPENPELVELIEQRRQAIAKIENVDPQEIPADALTASSSGLDPHISPAYALLQAPRVAAERDLENADVENLVRSFVQGRDAGFLGEPTVNVVRLNIALAELDT
ncbi:potassium-transporting ATPase subunit KdpC [Saxibacter everestensis]|uniref:Potassium-transporting ATPase KdpC subunit n=1 Tax=Saxibacter everestensis TaxID=2909229 RepID=A0ABY8QWI9_9MICO|nr:potassium-transporting ATPase subunit KdpC [Brevibacteriaceae bacterium ZFBP1038]